MTCREEVCHETASYLGTPHHPGSDGCCRPADGDVDESGLGALIHQPGLGDGRDSSPEGVRQLFVVAGHGRVPSLGGGDIGPFWSFGVVTWCC